MFSKPFELGQRQRLPVGGQGAFASGGQGEAAKVLSGLGWQYIMKLAFGQLYPFSVLSMGSRTLNESERLYKPFENDCRFLSYL